MRLDETVFFRLLEAIYGTALDDNRWMDVFDLLQEGTGVEHHALHGYDTSMRTNALTMVKGYDESLMVSFEEYYWAINPWLPGLARAKVGKSISTEEVCREEQLRKTEYYNDFIRKADDVGSGGGIVLFRDNTRFLCLSGNIAFSHRDAMQSNWLSLVDSLAPHLRNAFELRRQLAGQRLTDASYLTALDTIPNAVFLLNNKGQVSYANPSGREMLGERIFVYQDSKGTLRTHDPHTALVLGKIIYDIGMNLGLTETGDVVIHAFDGCSCVVGTLAPFSPDPTAVDRFAAFAARDIPVAILTINRSQPAKPPARELLLGLYKLTPAETDLALALFQGLSLTDYADLRQVSKHTVRNQLRKVFEKTDTSKQSQLVALLAKYSA